MTDDIESQLPHYEGLVYVHARRIVGCVEMDLDDIRQVYRLKVWRALRAYDPKRSRMPVERFVFCCLKNAEKDLLKKRRHGEVLIDEFPETPVLEEEVYSEVLDCDVLVPNTLDQIERRVVALLYAGYPQIEVARRLGIQRSAMDRVVKSVRVKMADWRPTPSPVAEPVFV